MEWWPIRENSLSGPTTTDYNIYDELSHGSYSWLHVTRKRVRADESNCVIADGSRLSGLTKCIKSEGKISTRVLYLRGLGMCTFFK
jgi:hypothetical protein